MTSHLQESVQVHDLDESQVGVLERLLAKFRSLPQISEKQSSAPEGHLPSTFSTPENIFGILGGRGAGKSTLLWELYRQLKQGSYRPALPQKGLPLLLAPIDCTALPPEVVPGAAVLIQLLEALESIGQEAPVFLSDLQKLIKELHSIIGVYSRTTKTFLDLCLDLSTSPKDYGEFFSNGIRDRLALSKAVSRVLRGLSEVLGVNRVIVFLDDFDLVPADAVRSWLASFLDDLRQERLIFVLTADFHRLEYLSWKAEDQFDDKTGRALLGKVIPAFNRFEIESWGDEAKLRYKPLGSKGANLGELVGTIQERISLGAQSEEEVWALFKKLLPGLPRGLRSIYAGLEGLLEAKVGRDRDHTQAPDEGARFRLVIKLLAVSRQEPLFSRRLEEVPLAGWPPVLKFGAIIGGQIMWLQLIRSSIQRLRAMRKPQDSLEALEALVPYPTPADFRDATLRRSRQFGEATPLFGAQLQHDPQWTDPLRHDHLRLLPLRDVADKDWALWTEMLLDLGFAKDLNQRVAFIFSWNALYERLKKCVIRLEGSRFGLNEFFSDNHGKIQREVFAWIEIRNLKKVRRLGDESSSYSISVGLEPLLNLFRSGREIVPWQLLEQLRIGRGWHYSVPGANPLEPAGQGRLIPGTVSAMILFMEGLGRCPWEAFSGKISHPVILYLAVACSFVRAAFLWALREAGLVDVENVDSVQRTLLGLISRSRQDFIDLPADEILVECCRFLASDPNVPRDNPLADALAFFCQSPFYNSVLGLLRVQPEIRGISAVDPRSAEQSNTASELVS